MLRFGQVMRLVHVRWKLAGERMRTTEDDQEDLKQLAVPTMICDRSTRAGCDFVHRGSGAAAGILPRWLYCRNGHASVTLEAVID